MAVGMVLVVRVMATAAVRLGDWLRPAREDQMSMEPAVRMSVDMATVPMRDTRSRHLG
jgi:hypothetical protein